jgi:hypothetical protein
MAPEHPYAPQKLWEATYVLVGDGTMSERLGFARQLLALLNPENDLPVRLQTRFRALMADLNQRVRQDDHRRRIISRRPKSGRMAREILELYTDLLGGI